MHVLMRVAPTPLSVYLTEQACSRKQDGTGDRIAFASWLPKKFSPPRGITGRL